MAAPRHRKSPAEAGLSLDDARGLPISHSKPTTQHRAARWVAQRPGHRKSPAESGLSLVDASWSLPRRWQPHRLTSSRAVGFCVEKPTR